MTHSIMSEHGTLKHAHCCSTPLPFSGRVQHFLAVSGLYQISILIWDLALDWRFGASLQPRDCQTLAAHEREECGAKASMCHSSVLACVTFVIAQHII